MRYRLTQRSAATQAGLTQALGLMRALSLVAATLVCITVSLLFLVALQMSAMEDCIDIGNGAASFGSLKCTLPAGSEFTRPWDSWWYRLGAVAAIALSFVPTVIFLRRRTSNKA